MEELENDKAYRIPAEERIERIDALLNALAHLDGGAKQAQHYTDVSPDLLILAVTKGGNHIFGHVVGANAQGKPTIKIDALRQALTVFRDQVLSKIYVGWVQGYLDEERARFEAALQSDDGLKEWVGDIIIEHPRDALQALTMELKQNYDWLA
ncbi:MAG: hypothetical protein IBX64_12295 [Actinobacteria bacterium]|nr:hypothetical protein [Actinomycetota bacterium]